jgi:hypothetical protein
LPDGAETLRALLPPSGAILAERFGPRATQAARRIVLDTEDTAFQATYLNAMAPFVDEGRAALQTYAELYDLLAVKRGAPQRYGTQGTCRDGAWQPAPVEDRDALDRLRQEAGFEPFAAFAERAGSRCLKQAGPLLQPDMRDVARAEAALRAAEAAAARPGFAALATAEARRALVLYMMNRGFGTLPDDDLVLRIYDLHQARVEAALEELGTAALASALAAAPGRVPDLEMAVAMRRQALASGDPGLAAQALDRLRASQGRVRALIPPLADGIAFMTGAPQPYGTAGHCSGGDWQRHETVAIAELYANRTEAQLGPLELSQGVCG